MLTRRMPRDDEDALLVCMKFGLSTLLSSEAQALLFAFLSFNLVMGGTGMIFLFI